MFIFATDSARRGLKLHSIGAFFLPALFSQPLPALRFIALRQSKPREAAVRSKIEFSRKRGWCHPPVRLQQRGQPWVRPLFQRICEMFCENSVQIYGETKQRAHVTFENNMLTSFRRSWWYAAKHERHSVCVGSVPPERKLPSAK
jgi:hypothetical protein